MKKWNDSVNSFWTAPFIVKSKCSTYPIFDCLNKKDENFLYIKTLKEIPSVFDRIPDWYINNVAHWWNYSETEMDEKMKDWSKKLLHLDIDFGKKCKLSCPHCFKNNKTLEDLNLKELNLKELSNEDLKNIVLEFKNLWLKTIKIVGAGEPFDNKDFLPFLEFLRENNLWVSVFTKGYVLGNDEYVSKLYGHLWINTGLDLCKKLKELDVSVLFGLNSFDSELQKKHSGAEKWNNYINHRDQALINLVNAWLNEYNPLKASRLAIVMAPVKPENLLESKYIYIRARMRNIYPVCCPANNAGLWKDENKKISKEYGDYEKDLIKLYTDIYIRNIENGIIDLASLEEEWIWLYPWAHPCTQTSIGFYIDLYGQVMSCVWHDTEDLNLRLSDNILNEQDYKKMRQNSANYSRTWFNQKCIARDGITLWLDFYDKIMKNIQEYFKE
jgi:organic radical activating enzyme